MTLPQRTSLVLTLVATVGLITGACSDGGGAVEESDTEVANTDTRDPSDLAEDLQDLGAIDAAGVDTLPDGEDSAGDVAVDTDGLVIPPDPPYVVEVAAGEGHSCALSDGGDVWCWGRVREQYTPGPTDPRVDPRPTWVAGLPPIVQISAGGIPAYHDGRTCGVSDVGDVYCWGNNGGGAILPDDSVTEYLEPVRIENVSGAIKVQTGYRQSCALLDTGTVTCWGDNDHYGLGRAGGAGDLHQPPASVEGVADAIDLAVGNIDHTEWQGPHSCVLLTDRTVACWGNNHYGQCGNGETTGTGSSDGLSMATAVVGLPGAVQKVATGSSHTCAVLESGEVWCWGRNDHGQIAADPLLIDHSPIPLLVPGIDTATDVMTGGKFSCALLTSGAVTCWGKGDEGQLGQGRAQDSALPANPIAHSGRIGGPAPTHLAAGGRHACLADEDGRVACWGSNILELELGAGRGANDEVPGVVNGTNPASLVAAGPGMSCLSDGFVWCWGANSHGQLGDSSQLPSTRPRLVLTPGAAGSFESISVGGTDDGIGPLAGAFGCGVTWDGAVWCWGYGGDGQLGHGDTPTSESTPVLVPTITDAADIDTGRRHTCVRRDAGQLACWGDNSHGQLGTGDAQSSSVPVTLTTLPETVQHHSVGHEHTCALGDSGQVYCWGRNAYDELGTGDDAPRDVPTAVAGLDDAVDVGAGRTMSCAVHAGGTVSCWGRNESGELGLGDTDPRLAPTPIPGLTNIVSIEVGEGTASPSPGRLRTCALSATGEIFCWGYDSGQTEYFATPTRIDGLGTVVDLSVGHRQVCAVDSDQNALCWGSNTTGELGDFAYPFAADPVLVDFAAP